MSMQQTDYLHPDTTSTVGKKENNKKHAHSPQKTTHTTSKNNPIVAFACPDRRAVVRSSMTRSGRSSPLAATHPSHADLRLLRT
ncbi:hypothetical protein BGZ61DRAFT_170116 [Ilyonectria robusta]|uniref:uncharacterized protein n=1 Tax=Ilyonectria robusta TaxID=1079257 RepID=UPI001E8D9B91|nr:uncharacterized protein BGZ61DRAFT_170116 [Ilyonectria robusta]KAH8734090.1 hypothetical protein BGZ61DRAFT_170116 [Ilyonectria robusta]